MLYVSHSNLLGIKWHRRMKMSTTWMFPKTACAESGYRPQGNTLANQTSTRIIIAIYIYIWLLIKIPLSRDGHSSRIKKLLSRNFRKLHVYLSRGPCWPTTPLMKIRSPPAKLRQRITDHFLVAF